MKENKFRLRMILKLNYSEFGAVGVPTSYVQDSRFASVTRGTDCLLTWELSTTRMTSHLLNFSLQASVRTGPRMSLGKI